MPDPKLLRLEITEVEGAVKQYQAQPDGPVEAQKPLALAFQRMDRHQNLQVTAGIQIRFSASRKALTITRQIQRPRGRAVQPGPPLQMMRQKLEEQHKRMEAERKAGGRRQREAVQRKMGPIEEGLAHLDLIEHVDKQARIHYRILLDSGSHQVPLFDSQIAEAP